MILADKGIKEIVRPEYTAPLKSVQKKLLESKPVKTTKVIETKSPLELILHSKSQILILKLLFLNPAKTFHQNGIARKTGLTPPAVSKSIANLTKLGLVTRRSQGSMSFYRTNRQCIIFDEMKRIFLKYEIFSSMLSDNLVDEDVRYALVYGSFAKGTENESSGIDLLVVGNVAEDCLLDVIVKIEKDTGREINFILWTENEFMGKAQKRIPIVREILKTLVIMIVGDKNEFKRSVTKGRN